MLTRSLTYKCISIEI